MGASGHSCRSDVFIASAANVNDADAITLVVFSNRKAIGYPDAVCLHRPEKGLEHTLGKTLQRAILWAGKVLKH